jgi:hypothetical protein
MFKRLDRLHYRANNVRFREERRPPTPVHLKIKEESKTKASVANFLMNKISDKIVHIKTRG